jgi:hypothetical protein
MTKQLVKKISASSIGVDVKAAKTEVQDVYTIIGYADGIEQGTHATNGEWTKLTGNFEATNVKTGEVFVSTAAFLPSVVNGLVAAAIKEGGTVKFAYRIGTKPNGTPIGYEYTVSELIEAEPIDVIEQIRAAAGLSSAPALSAPKKK